MWGAVAFFVVFAHPMPIKQAKKLVSGHLIQIISTKVLQEITTILQLKVYIVYLIKKLVGHPP